MGSINIGSEGDYRERVWSKAVEHQVERQAVGMTFLGTGDNATIMLKNELSKTAGEDVLIKFSPTEEVDGITESMDVYQNAQKINLFSDRLYINYLAFPFGLDSPMDQQRTKTELKRIIFHKAKANWIRRFEGMIWMHLAGYTPGNTLNLNASTAVIPLAHVGWNTVIAMDSEHLIRAKGLSTDAAVAADTSAVANLGIITSFETRAMSESYMEYPIAPGQDGYYDCTIHPMQWQQMRDNSTASEWNSIQHSRIQGGEKFMNSGLANGWMGTFSKTRIHVSDKIPPGVTSGAAQANTRRMVFTGRCAGAMAFGQGYADGSHVRWSEEVHQHKKWSLLTDSILGFKAIIFNDKYYGSMACTTYTPV